MSTPFAAPAKPLGRVGRHAGWGGRWQAAGPWAMLALTVSWLVLMLRQVPCLIKGGDFFPAMCYSDISVLFYWRGISEGKVPYLQADLEYPVLTGALIDFTRRLTNLLGGQTAPGLSSEQVATSAALYFGVNAVVLFVLFGVLVWTHLKLSRPWDALMIAASPAIMTAGLINWDALVVALTSLALLAWSRRRPGWAGVWLGLGVAAKLYPVLLLVPLAVLCLRTSRWRDFFVTTGTTLGAWVAVNLPIYLLAPQGWINFWTFNVDRTGDLGSVWYVLSLAGVEIPRVSLWVAVLMVLGTLAICLLLLLSPQRARLSQGVFLVVALFLMLNKVYSPQYVLWLLPLLVLARPRWREWIVFSVAELVYFVAIWAHLDGALYSGGGTQDRLYWLAVGLRVAVQFWLCVQVIRDIVDPRRDIVRAQGADDPDGGVFDGAADAPWLLAARASLVRG